MTPFFKENDVMLSSSKMRFGTLALALAAILAAPAAAQTPKKFVKVYFSPGGGGHEAIGQILNVTRSTVDVAMYSISAGQAKMWGPLVEAVKRGVKCRFILNEASSTAMAGKAQALENIGCDVRFVKGVMHNKFALFDRFYLSTGSANWSTGADMKYSENVLIYSKFPGVVADFQAEFDRLWAASADFPSQKKAPTFPKGAGTMPPARDGVYSIFTSQNSAATYLLTDAIVGLVNNAKQEVDIMVAHFDSATIKDAVCAAVGRKLRVRVLLDQGQFNVSASQAKNLEKCKAEVRYKVYGTAYNHARSQLLHDKSILVDRKWLGTGSYNWSNTAEKANQENLQVVTYTRSTAALIKAFQHEFETLWDLNRAKVPALIEAFTTKTVQPLHWDTAFLKLAISLTRPEYAKVRAKAISAGAFDRTKAQNSAVNVETRQFYPQMPSGQFDPRL
jgi:phosphatidylserine/phosphatidylglycerophosphate/cardiolipin synthase-like enzyme